ncbi:MAG: ChrR family anti-sigma-E factor [Pseudomonadota bacterium]
MIHHHPDTNILAEYAAGTLDTAQAIAVRAHLHYCKKCAKIVQEMEQVGGAMLEELSPQDMPEDSFATLMAAIDNNEPHVSSTVPAIQTHSDLPKIINQLMGGENLRWRKVNKSLKTASLTLGQKNYEVSLQRICAGGTTPEHDHQGTEMTVVLEGSFSDENGIYREGDFLLKQPGDIHQPVSAQHQDCLCLSVQEAPVKLTGLWGKFINPFIRLHPA